MEDLLYQVLTGEDRWEEGWLKTLVEESEVEGYSELQILFSRIWDQPWGANPTDLELLCGFSM